MLGGLVARALFAGVWSVFRGLQLVQVFPPDPRNQGTSNLAAGSESGAPKPSSPRRDIPGRQAVDHAVQLPYWRNSAGARNVAVLEELREEPPRRGP